MSTKDLSLVYFDGQSASLTSTGTLDSQTALLRGEIDKDPTDDFIYNERARGLELCQLADDLGVDGIMRMNAGFETLICDYSKSALIEIYRVNVTAPDKGSAVEENDLPQDPNRAPPLGIGNVFAEQNSWEWVRSGTWHYGGYASNGNNHREQRVQLDSCGMITFYDPQLQSVIGEHHSGVRRNETYQNGWGVRRGHRLLSITKQDSRKVKGWLRTVLKKESRNFSLHRLFSSTVPCSGVNWQALAETITDHHKSRVTQISHLLKQDGRKDTSTNDIVTRLHELSHAVLYLYLQYPSGNAQTLAAAKQMTVERCSSLFTDQLPIGSYNEFEALLKDSIKIVLERLCGLEWALFEWADKIYSGLVQASQSKHIPEYRDEDGTLPIKEIGRFRERMEELMNWLGWGLWTDCERKCS